MKQLGRIPATINDEQRQLIESMINGNNGATAIYKKLTDENGPLKDKGGFSYSKSFLDRYIKDSLNKKWDKKSKVWIDLTPSPKEESKRTLTSCMLTPLIQNTILDKIDRITKTLDSINLQLNELNSRVEKAEKLIHEIKLDNPYGKNISLSKDFLNIYLSKKKKKAITINKEIIHRVTKHMKEHHNITENESMAIDAALLLSLYQSTPSSVDPPVHD